MTAPRDLSPPEVIERGDVVQIDPEHDEAFGGCFMVVTEVKAWGVVGYVAIPGKQGDRGDAYYRCPNEGFLRIGHATWIRGDESEDDS